MTTIWVRWMNPDTYQIKHHQVFIRDETCFSSEIKHLHYILMRCFLDKENSWKQCNMYCNTRENMSHCGNFCFITGSKRLGEAIVLVFDILRQT